MWYSYNKIKRKKGITYFKKNLSIQYCIKVPINNYNNL